MAKTVKISEQTWRKVKDAVEAEKTTGLPNIRSAIRDNLECYCQNLTGGHVEQYQAVGICKEVSPINPYYNVEAFLQQRVLSLQTLAQHHLDEGRFGIAAEPIPAEGIGRVIIQGIVPVKSESASSGSYAKPIFATPTLFIIDNTPSSLAVVCAPLIASPDGAYWYLCKLGGGSGSGSQIRNAYFYSNPPLPADPNLGYCRLDNRDTGEIVSVMFRIFNGTLDNDFDTLLPPLSSSLPIPVCQIGGQWTTLWWFTGTTSCVED